MIALISQLISPSFGRMFSLDRSLRTDIDCNGALAIDETAVEILRQFAEPTFLCGSISLVNPDEKCLLRTGLAVAAQMQRALGLKTGWCSIDGEQIRKIAEINHFEKFDVDIVPIAMQSNQFDCRQPIDLLIFDSIGQFSADELQLLDEQFDPQVVLGLSTHSISQAVGQCFDRNLTVSWEWNDSHFANRAS